jgi:hypothetical protein
MNCVAVDNPWAPARSFQCLDVKLQDWGAGFVGPVLTELFSGAVHAIPFYGLATAMTLPMQWRWALAVLTYMPWMFFAVKRARRSIARRDGLPAEQSAERSCLTDAALKRFNWPAGVFLLGWEIVMGIAIWWC